MSILLAATPGAAPQRALEVEVQHWLRGVHAHRPGVFDPAARQASQWPWARLEPVLREIRERGTPVAVLRTAALLTDIAIHLPLNERPQASIPGYAVIGEDGRPQGRQPLDSHLAAARRVLEGIASEPAGPADPESRAVVIEWYRTTSAILGHRHNLADWQPHVIRSLARFPDDAGILFDAGCFNETFAAPFIQSVIATRENRSRRPTGVDLSRDYLRSPAALRTEAEKLFRRSIERTPSFAEARVRLGRLLALRGRADEAIGEFKRAQALDADDTVKYYAFLFLGDALASTGPTAEALRAVQAAAALFPDAQSAHLSIAQMAGELRDNPRARASIDRILTPDTAHPARSDPWWVYASGSGRNHEAVYSAFAERVHALPDVDAEAWRK